MTSYTTAAETVNSRGPETGLRIAHLQPQSLDFYGHADADLGTRVRYSVSNLAAAQSRLGERPAIHLLKSRGRLGEAPPCLRVQGFEAHFHPAVEPLRLAGTRFRFARQLSLSMLRSIRRGQVDVVHFHGIRQFHGMYAAVAWRARAVNLPLVGQDRGYRPVGRLEAAGQSYGLRRSTCVCAASEEAVSNLTFLGVPPDAIHLVPNGVDPAVFRPETLRDAPTRDPLRILVVSRLTEEKDPLTMAQALAELSRRGRRIEVTVLGPGELRSQVEAVLRGGSVAAIFRRHVAQERLAAYYRAADVFVHTSAAREGWAQAPLEAMACGLPVVATDVSGVKDVLGGAGRLVPPRDPGAVANAIEAVVNDEATWRRQREAGLERARAFTWEAVARQLADIYRSVV